jgi:ketosteroid isomerase-like protein
MGSVMSPALQSPGAVAQAFAAALSMGDLDQATACLCRESCLVTPDSTAVAGRNRIRDILKQLIAQRLEIATQSATVVEAGDIAYVTQGWRTRIETAGGPLRQEFFPVFIAHRSGEEWRIAVAIPWQR